MIKYNSLIEPERTSILFLCLLRAINTALQISFAELKGNMDALQQTAQSSDPIGVADGSSKFIETPRIVRKSQVTMHAHPKPVPRTEVTHHARGIITNVSI